MRLRTLPVSMAGVLFATGIGLATWHFSLPVSLLCMLFALLAQIASNFANEYFDFKAGFDKAGRVGPRRGVTEGDITPGAMLKATFLVLILASVTGCVLVALYGTWWMVILGVLVVIASLAYSAGPYPLSQHGLGEVAVIFFFGVIPVTLTYMLMGGPCEWWTLTASVGVGLMGANLLIVNNYRDIDDDRAVGKRTLAVRMGRGVISAIYFSNGLLAVLLTLPVWVMAMRLWWIVPSVYLICHFSLYASLIRREGSRLNPLLGLTAMLMFGYSLAYVLFVILS